LWNCRSTFKDIFPVWPPGFAFPITHDDDDVGDSCSPLPVSFSHDPHPPIGPLLKTKAQTQFDRAVTERSKPFFRVFQGSNRGQFQPCFLALTVRSAEGRKRKRLVFLANCQLPIASCLFSKIPHRIAAPRWEENNVLYYLFAQWSSSFLAF
jgi:hypothetical protein